MIVPEKPIKIVLESIIESLDSESDLLGRITKGRYDGHHGIRGWRIRRWSGFLNLMPQDMAYIWDMRENEPLRGKVFFSVPTNYLHTRPHIYRELNAYCDTEKIFLEEGKPPVPDRYEFREQAVLLGDDCADLGSFDDM